MEKLRVMNLSTFKFAVNAVPSAVLPRKPTPAPPVQTPGAGSVASLHPAPEYTMSPNVTVTTSIHAKTVLPGLMASILLQLIVRCAPGSARENSALRHRSGQPGIFSGRSWCASYDQLRSEEDTSELQS